MGALKHRMARRWSRGFTLTEVLVSAGIIAVLAALLLPSIQRARASAEGAVCQQSLRQIGAATRMYLNDNDNVMLHQCGYDDPEHFWWGWFQYLQPYLGEKTRNRKAPFCPTANRTLPKEIEQYTGYCFNGNLDGLKITRINDATKTPIAWDDVQKDETGYNNFYGGWPIATWGGGGSWYKFAFRHGGKCNLLFLDGHVESVLKGKKGTAEDYPDLQWGPFTF